MASNPYYANFVPAGNQQSAGAQAYGASAGQTGPGFASGGNSAPAGHSAGQTSYDTAYPNTAAFAAGYYGFAAKSSYEPKYFGGPQGNQSANYSTMVGLKMRIGIQVPTPRTGAALHCELCNVTCTSTDAYAAHIRGTKHQKVVKLHTKLGKPIPPAEPQLIHGSKATTAATSTTTTTTTSGTSAPAVNPTSSSKTPKMVSGTPKMNFLGGNYLNSLTGPKAAGSGGAPTSAAAGGGSVAPASAAGSAASAKASEKDKETPMTAAAATETALSVVAQWEEDKVIQPVGQDYVEELNGPDGKIIGFNCRLCDCRFNDVNAKDMHLKGRRHRLMFKKKVDPSLLVESKGWPAQRRNPKAPTTWLERKKSGEPYGEEMPLGPSGGLGEDRQPGGNFPGWIGNGPRGMRHGGPTMGLPPPPQFFPAGPMPNPALRKPESSDDRHVIAKHSEIYPSDEELESTQNLVSYVERALKLVSDELANNADLLAAAGAAPAVVLASAATPAAEKIDSKTSTDANAQQQHRLLKGVMRVGLLAKGLLLKGDRVVQLVVLCSQPPTFQLLETVAKVLPAHLSAVASSVTFTVEPHPEAAMVDVKAVQGHGLSGDILVQVALTSPVVREEQLAAAAAASAVTNGSAAAPTAGGPTNKNRLNTEHCLHALAQLRRAKWFQVL
nr:EOG090X037N [Sida crystallina]